MVEATPFDPTNTDSSTTKYLCLDDLPDFWHCVVQGPRHIRLACGARQCKQHSAIVLSQSKRGIQVPSFLRFFIFSFRLVYMTIPGHASRFSPLNRA
jgi:hypothetical protein